MCLEETSDRTNPCKHPVCKRCAKKWVQFNHNTCPMCRQPMLGDERDEGSKEAVNIDPRAGTFFGVTVRNASSGRGVIVTHTNPHDFVHASGLRSGTIITHINGIRVDEHQIAVLLLESARSNRTRIRIRTRTQTPYITAAVREIRAAFSRRFRHSSVSDARTTVHP